MKRKRISRSDKKKLRVMLLCHTGNVKHRKSKHNKLVWLELKNHYKTWLSNYNRETIKLANKLN
jgi:hypothetical protein